DMIWFPPPFKGAGGDLDMGYGIYDHFDAGEFLQNGTVETRFGSRAELENAIQAYHNAGIEVICDIVLNHVFGGNPEYNPWLADYILNRAWYPVMPYDHYLYVFAAAPAGRYYVQVAGNRNDHAQTAYDDREGYYSIRPWFNHASGQNADGQPHHYEWQIGDGDSGPFDAFRIDLPGRVMEGHINGVGDVDEYFIDHTGGWMEFKLNSTDLSGVRDFIIPQLWYDPDTTVNGDDYNVSDSLKIFTYTAMQPASGRFPKSYRNYHPVDVVGHNNISETYHYPYFGNDLCYFYSYTLDSLKAWGAWLTNTLGFDGYRIDLAKGIDPSYMAAWLNDPAMQNRYYVAEHWSSASEIKAWVDAVNSQLSGTRPMTAFDFPLFYALKEFCDNPAYDARNLHSAGLYPLYGHGFNITTFVHNHDVFRPYTSAHNPIINNAELAYAFILTHVGTATIFYPDYYGGTFYNADSTQSFTMPGLKTDIDNLLRIRKTFVSGNLHLLTQVGNPVYKPGDDRFATGDYSFYASNLYIAQREGGVGSGNQGGCIVVLNSHPTDAIGAWVTVQGNGVGATFLRDQTGHRTGVEEIFADNRVFVHAGPRSYAVWANSNINLALPIVRLKVYLQGPYDALAGQMTTYLSDNNLLPLTQPYNQAPWNYPGTESVTAIPAGVTDWVLVELRSGLSATPVVGRRAAFLRNDGKVVDLDGASPVSFNLAAGDYYLVLYHRNHLAIMSATPQPVHKSSDLYDFTTAQTRAYGTNPMREVAPGVFALRSGDGDGDGDVDAADKNLIWRPNNGTTWSYSKRADFNLDGGIDALDLNLMWRPNNG
ncbi:MAG: hypothetical protein D6681_07215, partial [Calditrichaeota bacterium]